MKFESGFTTPPAPGTSAAPAKVPTGVGVVVAEMNERRRKEYSVGLTGAGYAPFVVNDGVEAWGKIESHAAEALVVDMRFDGSGAKEVLGRLALSRRLFPVVALCDYDFPVGELPSLGRVKVLTKPVPAEQVVSSLEALMKDKAKAKKGTKGKKKR